MQLRGIRTLIGTAAVLSATLPVAGAATSPASAPASAPAVDGRMIQLDVGVLFVPGHFRGGPDRVDLLIHFHGDPATVARNVVAARLNCIVVIVNYPGLSAVYARPFQDRQLFGRIVEDALKRLKEHRTIPPGAAWGTICVSSFSAGFGAVREILKDQRYMDMIDGLCMADSIYAGYAGEIENRHVNPENMADFRRFAALAADGKKTFILSHSYLVPGSYASTIETADDLIHHIGGRRVTVSDPAKAPFQVLSKCEKGNFRVYGCAGTDGQAHMEHLRRISRWLSHLPLSRAGSDAATRPADR